MVSVAKPEACPECGGQDWVQDPDVLDTWFSSALWPFATLGWPQRRDALEYFYPTDLMITARDILYLWVLRMAMTSLEFVEQIPFKTVLVHPTILTQDGRRMSKSLGTGLNPLDLVARYGADATRYCLLAQAGAVQDVRFDAAVENNQVQASASAEAGRNFGNKLWNATRFVLMNIDGYEPGSCERSELADRWIWSRLQVVVREMTEAMQSYRFSDLTRAIYDFVWRDYCDWYLELAKVRLQGGGPQARRAVQEHLVRVLETALRLLHPIMPFITETLWQALPHGSSANSIMVADWPKCDDALIDQEAEAQMQCLQEVVTGVRIIRGEMNVPPGPQSRGLDFGCLGRGRTDPAPSHLLHLAVDPGRIRASWPRARPTAGCGERDDGCGRNFRALRGIDRSRCRTAASQKGNSKDGRLTQGARRQTGQ